MEKTMGICLANVTYTTGELRWRDRIQFIRHQPLNEYREIGARYFPFLFFFSFSARLYINIIRFSLYISCIPGTRFITIS